MAAVQFAIGLRLRGHDSRLLATRAGGDYEHQLLERDVPYRAFSRGSRWDPLAWGRIAAHIREGSFNVIHAHNPGSAVAIALLKPLLPRGTLVAVHIQMWPPRGSRYRAFTFNWFSRLRRLVDLVTVTTPRLKREAIELCGFAREQVHPIWNPVDLSTFAVGEPALESRSLRAIMVAQWRPQKDPITAIHAAAIACARGQDVELLLAGAEEDKQLVKEARREIDRLDLGDRVRILGRRRDIPDLLRGSDVGVLSTHFEGLPVSVIEKGACGLPVLVSDVEGLEELLDLPGVFSFPCGDAERLADHFCHLGSMSRRERQLVGSQLRAAIKARADREAVADQLASIYRQYLGRG